MVFLIRSFAFTSCLIPYSGMENSLFQGERILVNKWSYGLRVPFMSLFSYHRWLERPVGKQEIVVFNNPAAGTKLAIDRRAVYISRCIGTPGDTLLIDSCFSVVSPEAEVNPDKKQLYAYPASKEKDIELLLRSLSIANEGVMGRTTVRTYAASADTSFTCWNKRRNPIGGYLGCKKEMPERRSRSSFRVKERCFACILGTSRCCVTRSCCTKAGRLK